MAVKLGSQNAKTYHYLLIVGALITAIMYVQLNYNSPKQYLFLVAFIPLMMNVVVVAKNSTFSELDNELKKVALSTFLFAILFGIGQVL
jgi:1,4-dihydroxy-2-naphthoate octaprenyltransferase